MTAQATNRSALVAAARQAISVAAAALEAVHDVWEGLPSNDVTATFGDLLRLRALSEGAAAAVLMEATSRGMIAQSEHRREIDWIRAAADHAGAPITVAAATHLREASAQAALRDPDMRALRSSLTRGEVSASTAARLRRDLEIITARVPAPVADTAVAALMEYAATGASVRELAATREAIVASYGDEGTFEERQILAHQHREMTTWTKDAYDRNVCTLALDNAGRAAVDSAMSALAGPLPSRDADGRILVADDRTAGQRRADALVELCHVLAADPDLRRAAEEPASKGPGRAQVMLTMPLSHLRTNLGYALDEHGQPLPPARVRQLCCDAEVIPALLGGEGEVLDLGRSARTATTGQRRALRHRDGGCTFPGCTRPPSWCDAHHLIHWIDGGRTAVDNLALLCSHHHTHVHQHGYSGHLGPDGHIHWLRRPPDRQADRPPGVMAEEAPRRLVVNQSPAGPHIDKQAAESAIEGLDCCTNR